MAVENLRGDIRGTSASVSNGLAQTPRVCRKHFSMTAAASATSTYYVGRVPANGRPLLSSRIVHDDLASTGSPTLDIGLFAVNSNVTDDDDALNDGIDVASAASSDEGIPVVKDYAANCGKAFWEFVSGQTTNPGGDLDIYVTLKDADCNTGGDIYVEIQYVID